MLQSQLSKYSYNKCNICILGNSKRKALQTSTEIIAPYYYLLILHLLYILLHCMCSLSIQQGPRALESQFTFQMKHHNHMKRILFITGLSNVLTESLCVKCIVQMPPLVSFVDFCIYSYKVLVTCSF